MSALTDHLDRLDARYSRAALSDPEVRRLITTLREIDARHVVVYGAECEACRRDYPCSTRRILDRITKEET